MATGRGPLRTRRLDERGTSLIELMVAMFVLALLSTAVLSVTSSFLVNANGADQRFVNVGDAQTVMDVLTRDIRAATTVQGTTVSVAQGNAMTFYSALGANGGPTLVTFALTGTTLSQSATAGPSYTTPATSVMSRNIAIPPSGPSPLFTYYTNAGIATSNPAAVASVAINLVDSQGSLTLSDATLASVVWLRNVEYANN
jgi:prepilin-type N-terminal cleavage/methylation domain-containing protein